MTEAEIRQTAAADLRDKLEKLPDRAAPPVNTFYYDVRVQMNRMVSTEPVWRAIIQGHENVVDPATDETTLRTQFTLVVDYRDGHWFFQSYRAQISDFIALTSREVVEDKKGRTPPVLAAVLGLK